MNFNSQELYGLSNYKWVFSDLEIEELLLNMSSRNKIKFEKDSSIFRVKYILALLVLPISFIRILYVYCKQYFVVQSTIPHIKSVMLETGRGYELNNMHKVAKINDNNIIIQSYLLTDFMKHKRVGIRLLLKVLFNSISDFFHILSLKIPNRIAFLVIKIGIKNISRYSYYRSFFIILKRCHNNVTVYSDAALLQSHASIASKIRTVRTFHGLMGFVHPDIFPNYDTTYVYSKDEQRYLLGLGFKAEVYKVDCMEIQEKTVIFFMPYQISIVNSGDVSELVDLFSVLHYKIYIKPHPLNNAPEKLKKEYGLSQYNWETLLNLPQVEYINEDSEATFLINKRKPRFIVGWGSTSICEALNMGVIPINLSIDQDGLYPWRRRSLLWPLKKNIVKDLIFGNLSYQSEIDKLRAE